MYLRYSFTFCLLLCLFACKTKEEVEETHIPVLHVSALYATDSVRNYLSVYKDRYKDISDDYVRQSDEIIETNPSRSVYLIKRAITLRPVKENYLQLAKVLAKTNSATELSHLYFFLCFGGTELFGEPDAELWYQAISANIRAGLRISTEGMPADAKSQVLNRLLKDPDIRLDRNSTDFQDYAVALLADKDIIAYLQKPEVFRCFLHSVVDSGADFEVNEKNISKFNYLKDAEPEDEDDADAFGKGSFQIAAHRYLVEGRPAGDTVLSGQGYKVNFLRRYDINKDVHVVVYAIDTSEESCPVNMRHIYYRLATYSSDAKVIDHRVIAVQAGEQFNTASVHGNIINVTENRRRWEKPYLKKDFSNELMGIDKTGSVAYTIGSDGKIIQTPAQR